MMEVDERKVNNLTDDMKSLELSTPRRSGRKRSSSQVFQYDPPKGSTPVKKRSVPVMLTEAAIHKFYQNQTVGRTARQDLETIYEDPTNSKDGKVESFGVRKIKRSITFPLEFRVGTKQKRDNRKKRIKRLGLEKEKGKKISKDEFEKRLKNIETLLRAEGCDVSTWCTMS